MSKLKLRIKMSKESSLNLDEDIFTKIDRNLLDEKLCKMLKDIGVEPMVLDSILPPTSDIDWETVDYR
jgi:hypothetical protein